MTADQAQEYLDRWLAADAAVSTGQSYSIGSRTLTRASVREIRDQITYWTRQVTTLRDREQYGANARPGQLRPVWGGE